MKAFPLKSLAVAISAATAVFAHADDVVQQQKVVVSAAGFEQSTVEAPASISVISRDELEQKSYHSIAEALIDVEGVDVGDGTGKTGGLSISMRGMPSDYTLILIDGRRQNVAGNVTPNGFGGTSSSFIPPMSAIERIEIIRGPMSTLYGSDAMGGVVNIITRKVSEEWGGSINLSTTIQENSDYGNKNTTGFYLNGPLVEGKAGLALRGDLFQREASDLSYTANDGTTGEVSKRGDSPVESDIYNLGARLTFTPVEGQEIWLDLDRSRQRYDNEDGQLGTLGVRGYQEELRFQRDQVTLAHNADLGFGRLESSYMVNETETLGRVLPDGPNAGDDRVLEVENRVLDSKLITPIGNHMLSTGIQYWEAEMLDGVAPDKFEHTQWSVFGEDEWGMTDDLTLTVGARYDHHDQFGSHVSPRGYLVWRADDHWTLKGGMSGGYKTPRLDQLADGIVGFRGQGTIPYIGTPSLQPETSVSTEIGAHYDSLTGFSAGVTLFNNEFEDKITDGPALLNCSFEDAPNRPGCVDYGFWPNVDEYGQSVNVDEAVTRGVELTTTLPLADRWTLGANYTYTDSEQKSGPDKGKPLTNTPEHMFNAKLNWAVSPHFSAWLRGEYRSERYRSDETTRDQIGDYKAYSLFHLGGRYQLSQNVTLNGAIYNLFDKDFVDYANYTDSRGRNSYTNRYAIHEEGRRLWLSMNVTF